MATQANTSLVKLTGTVVTATNASDDMRGRKAKDKDHKHFGRVHDVFVDDRERKPRVLVIDHGGLLASTTITDTCPAGRPVTTTHTSTCERVRMAQLSVAH